jgi:hypothetical protein
MGPAVSLSPSHKQSTRSLLPREIGANYDDATSMAFLMIEARDEHEWATHLYSIVSPPKSRAASPLADRAMRDSAFQLLTLAASYDAPTYADTFFLAGWRQKRASQFTERIRIEEATNVDVLY